MVVDPHAAQLFIAGYKSVLTEVHKLSYGKPQKEIIRLLSIARNAAVEAPSLIDAAVTSLRANGNIVDPVVLRAIKTLMVKQWVFLRDTKTYSIFIDIAGKDAFAVLGLTDRIQEIVGGSGNIFRSGLVSYQGRYVCDGIIEDLVWLGTGIKKDFSSEFAHIKKSGRFHTLSAP